MSHVRPLSVDNIVAVDPRIRALDTRAPMKRSENNRQRGDEGTVESHFFREIQIELLIHDLDDPFVIIEAGLQSLMNKRDKFGPLTPEQERILHRSLRATLRGRSMLSILLEVGRSEFGRIIPNLFSPARVLQTNIIESVELLGSDVADKVRELDQETDDLEDLLASEGIVIDIPRDIEDLEIFQDENSFSEITGNLIKNALRFRKKQLNIKCYQIEDLLAIEISDDGQGIPAENHDLIFQPFAQTDVALAGSRRGRGLGLAAARVLARRLGGDITVQSEVGRGATFLFTVPVTRPTPVDD